MTWRIVGKKFSWSRDENSRLRIWLYPEWHSLTPNLNQQYPDLEYDEVVRLNALEAYVVVNLGNNSDLVNEVKASHRVAGYFPDQDDPPSETNVIASLIDNRLCFEIRLDERLLEKVLGDLLAVASHFDGHYVIGVGDRLVEFNRSLGLKPDAKALFLGGEIPVMLRGHMSFSFSIGCEAPRRPSEHDLSLALKAIAEQ
jgi:hypothetical protein